MSEQSTEVAILEALVQASKEANSSLIEDMQSEIKAAEVKSQRQEVEICCAKETHIEEIASLKELWREEKLQILVEHEESAAALTSRLQDAHEVAMIDRDAKHKVEKAKAVKEAAEAALVHAEAAAQVSANEAAEEHSGKIASLESSHASALSVLQEELQQTKEALAVEVSEGASILAQELEQSSALQNRVDSMQLYVSPFIVFRNVLQ